MADTPLQAESACIKLFPANDNQAFELTREDLRLAIMLVWREGELRRLLKTGASLVEIVEAHRQIARFRSSIPTAHLPPARRWVALRQEA